MKELSIEEKTKRYDEAIERAKSVYNETAIPSATTKGICTYIFPELKESEDEKIRKALIRTFNEKRTNEHINGVLVGDILAWSLAALLNYLKSKNKFPEIKELSDGRFKLTTFIWDGKNSIQVSIADNLVDACYEMIIKFHELKTL